MSTQRPDARKFLKDVSGRYARAYEESIDDMLVAMLMGNRIATQEARHRFEEVVRQTMGVGEVLGSSLVLQEAAKVITDDEEGEGAVMLREDRWPMVIFASDKAQNILPRVTFVEALEDLVTRTPVTIRNAAQRNAVAIAKLYGEGRVIAFAKAAEQTVTEKAQKTISDMIKAGTGQVDAGRRIVESVDAVRVETKEWSQSYARMVYRTNLNTAVSAGRFRQMRDPQVRKIMPAMQFLAVGDSDTRSSHNAAHRVVLASDDPRWNTLAPPLGYNCRCTVRGMSTPALRRMNRLNSHGGLITQAIPSAAKPDANFRHGGRPDIFTAGNSR